MAHSSIIAREGWPYIGIFVLLTIFMTVIWYNYYLRLFHIS